MTDSVPESSVVLTAGTCWYLWNFRRTVISSVTARGLKVIVFAPPDEWSKPLAEMPGVFVEDWPVSLNGSSLGQEIKSFWIGLRVIFKLRPVFVLNHGIKSNIYIGIACRLLRVAYANNVTGLGTRILQPGLQSRVLAHIYAFASSGSAPLVVQNFDDAKVLKRAGLSRKVRIERTMGSGVDLNHFSFIPLPTSRERVFLFIGRLQYDKGIEDFVNASRVVLQSRPDCRFIAVGSTLHANDGAISEVILEKWRSETAVEFVGHQEDVRPWIEQCHVVVMPSHGGEGIPKVLLETAAIGRPAIVTNVAGCKEAIIPGKSGMLCAPCAPESLGKAILSLNQIRMDELTVMGKNARNLAVEKFSDMHVVDVAMSSIEDAVGWS